MALKMIPDVDASPQVGPMKMGGGFSWRVKFTLRAPAPRDGHFFQEISISNGGPNQPGSISHFVEAWPVKRGETETVHVSTLNLFLGTTNRDPRFDIACNDMFLGNYASGQLGFHLVQATVAYFDEPLPRGFKELNPATKALGLPSREVDATHKLPKFWKDRTGLFRMLRFDFDFTPATGADPANATLKTVILSPGRIGDAPADTQWTTWASSA